MVALAVGVGVGDAVAVGDGVAVGVTVGDGVGPDPRVVKLTSLPNVVPPLLLATTR